MTTFPEEFQASIEISASPDTVWALVADVTRMGEWSPECVGADWVDGATGPAVDARFDGHNKIGDFTWDAPGVVVPNDLDNASTWRFEFASAASGTRVTQSFNAPLLNLEGSPSNFEGRYEMLCAGVQTTLENLKAAAE